jgi:hypothetical protein
MEAFILPDSTLAISYSFYSVALCGTFTTDSWNLVAATPKNPIALLEREATHEIEKCTTT